MITMRRVESKEILKPIYRSVLKEVTMNANHAYLNYIDGLFYEKGKRAKDHWELSFKQLDKLEQYDLVALKIKETDFDTSEVFNQPDRFAKDNTLTKALLNLLANPSQTKEFAESAINCALSYYHSFIQSDIDDRCSSLRATWIESRGFNE